MKIGVYAVYDKMTGYMLPTFKQNDAQAIRDFGYDITSQEMNLIKANPEDFNLQKIGTYDNDTGVIEPCTITILCDAGQFTRQIPKKGKVK